MGDVEVGTKRSAGYDEYENDSLKVSKSDGIQVRMLLVGQSCGAIVGKGGENLSRLRKEYNVDVQMPGARTVDRVFAMNGNLDDCLNVVKEILPHAPKAPYPVAQKTELEVNILVDTDLVGQILGKGGSKIKEIREESNTKIKVYQDCLPNSTERVVAIGGEEQQIVEALKAILDILANVPRRSAPMYYDPINKPSEIMGSGITGGGRVQNSWGNDTTGNIGHQSDFLQVETETKITVNNEMCGAIIGKGGLRIREIKNVSGARINISESDKESKQDRIITINGTQQQVQAAEQLMTQSVRNSSNL